MPYPQIEVTVKYKCAGKRTDSPIVGNAAQALEVIRAVCNKKQILWVEEALMLCLDKGGKLMGWYRLSTGGTTETIMDVRMIATIAAKCAASRIVIAHNHPSGNVEPGYGDVTATGKIRKGMETIGMVLDDHIIFSEQKYFSFREGGLIG